MKKLYGVFEGGGVKGIGLVGALYRLEQDNVKFAGVGGTSAGSLVAAMYAAGYSAKQMKEILEETDFENLLDPSRPQIWHLWFNYGIHWGKKLYEWIYIKLEKMGVVTFSQLKEIDLRIVAADLTNKQILVFDRKSYPEMKIAEAVRMSISLPLFFHAYKLGEKLVVDGGLLSNYPVWLFDEVSSPTSTPTGGTPPLSPNDGKDGSSSVIGFKLISDKATVIPEPPNSFPGYLSSLVSTMLEARDKADSSKRGFFNTIHIPTGDIATTSFALTKREKKFLFDSGFVAASEFIRTCGPDFGIAVATKSKN